MDIDVRQVVRSGLWVCVVRIMTLCRQHETWIVVWNRVLNSRPITEECVGWLTNSTPNPSKDRDEMPSKFTGETNYFCDKAKVGNAEKGMGLYPGAPWWTCRSKKPHTFRVMGQILRFDTVNRLWFKQISKCIVSSLFFYNTNAKSNHWTLRTGRQTLRCTIHSAHNQRRTFNSSCFNHSWSMRYRRGWHTTRNCLAHKPHWCG